MVSYRQVILTCATTLLLLLFTFTSASALTLYVDPTHPSASDATSRVNNSASLPWVTLCRAVKGAACASANNTTEAAQAGDLVIVSAGTYSAPGTRDRFLPAFNPVNNGSAGNPITFRCVTARQCQLILSTFYGPIAGAGGTDGADYIIWDGFYVREIIGAADGVGQSKGDTAPVIFFTSNNSQWINGRIEAEGTFYGPSGSCTPSDSNWGECLIFVFNDQGTGSPLTPPVNITSSASGTPGVFTLATAGTPCDEQQGYCTGQVILVRGHTGSTPTVTDGYYVIMSTPTSSSITIKNVFSASNVAMNLTAGGSGGTIQRIRQDNRAGIRLNNTSNSLIANTIFKGFYGAHDPANQGAIETYQATTSTIENNDISFSNTGIYMKGGVPGSGGECLNCIIRYNKFHRIGARFSSNTAGAADWTGYSIALHGNAATTSGAPFLIYQNIIYKAFIGLHYHQFNVTDPLDNPMFSKFLNNTLVDVQRGIHQAGSIGLCRTTNCGTAAGHLVQNNLVTNITANAIYFFGPDAMLTSDVINFVRNWYFTYTQFASIDVEGANPTYTFATWQSSKSYDVNGTSGTDPQFVNSANEDFHIQNATAQSAGRAIHGVGGADNTVIPVGAYITGSETIGTTGGAGGSTGRKYRLRIRIGT